MTIPLTEIRGNAFNLLKTPQFDAVCVTTNGVTKQNGDAVMGAGVALACARAYPETPRLLGDLLRRTGNVTQVMLETPNGPIIAFPTKNHWRDASDIELIKKSCRELMAIVNKRGLKHVLLPKPGCANGGLDWNDVHREIAPLLDWRITIISM